VPPKDYRYPSLEKD